MLKGHAPLLRKTLVLGLFVLPCSAQADTPLIQNGGFETGSLSPYWTTTGGGIAIDSSASPGPQAGKYYVSFSGTTESEIYQKLATTAGKSYLVSFYLDTTGSSTGNNISAYFGGTATGQDGQQLQGSTNFFNLGYNEYSYQVVATGDDYLKFFGKGSTDGTGEIYLDTVSVTTPPPPALFAMLAGGTLGALRLARLRRSRKAV